MIRIVQVRDVTASRLTSHPLLSGTLTSPLAFGAFHAALTDFHKKLFVFRVQQEPHQTVALFIPDRFEEQGRYSPSTGAFAVFYFGGSYRKKLDLPGFELEFDSTRVQVFFKQLSSSFLWLRSGSATTWRHSLEQGAPRISVDVRRFGRKPAAPLVTKELLRGFEVYVVDSRTPARRPTLDITDTRGAFLGASFDDKEGATPNERLENNAVEEVELFPDVRNAAEADSAEAERVTRRI